MEELQKDVEYEEFNKKIDEWNEKLNSFENEEEKSKYMDEHMDEFESLLAKGNEVIDNSFSELNDIIDKFTENIKNGNIVLIDDENKNEED